MNIKIVHHHFVYVSTPTLGWDTYTAVNDYVCMHFDKYHRINNNPLHFNKLYNFKNFFKKSLLDSIFF